MLRKCLIPTVVVSIFLLLTTLTSITKTEATSVTTSATTTTAAATTHTRATSITTATAQQQSAETSAVNKFLNNAKETTTSLLPLQPPLNVTSTTLASFILNQKHLQQQQKQHRLVQVLEETQQFQEHLLNDNVNEKRETKKKNLDYAFATVTSPVAIITTEPSSTHAYIPFDLDYNDPTEEKAAEPEIARQSTINEVLINLFPKGFSDIFRFSYADDAVTTTSAPATEAMLPLIRSTPTPFKPMPTTKPKEKTKIKYKEIPNTSSIEKENAKNVSFITMSTSVTKETRREISPGHTEIVVEKIITEPNSYNSTDDFKDGSNSISKDELLRINRAAKEASVLPSLLVMPQYNSSSNKPANKSNAPIVILNESDNDDFVDAPEDDNQIAESQNVVHEVYQKAPPPESTNFQVTQNHQYNVRIIHDDTLRKAQDEGLEQLEKQPQRHSPSYQSFVEQSKYIQNSLQEAPSRKFLKNFTPTALSQDSNPSPVAKGNFHYEQHGPKNFIQTVPPAAQLQYQQQEQQHDEQHRAEQLQHLHTQVSDSQPLNTKDVYQTIESENREPQSGTPINLVFVTINTPAPPIHETPKQPQSLSQQSFPAPSIPLKSPHEFVSEALGLNSQQITDHQTQETVDQPKPSNGGYTFVEVQKSVNIRNKLITEKDGQLIEQHETIYPEHQYRDRLESQTHVLEEPMHNQNGYISLSDNPIHVEQLEEKTNSEEYELAASLKDEQHTINPSQEFGPIQQSNLVQESHIIGTPLTGEAHGTYGKQPENHETHLHTNDHQIYIQTPLTGEAHGTYGKQPESHEEHLHTNDHQIDSQTPLTGDAHGIYGKQPENREEHLHTNDHQIYSQHQQHYLKKNQDSYPHAEDNYHHEEYRVVKQHQPDHQHSEENHYFPMPSQDPYQPPIQIPYALPQHHYQAQQSPLVYQEIIEKHIPMPYAVPEPVGVPVHIQHFVDRPYPVETIVEKPVPYPVETIVEKVVEKHVPVEVEKIVEKPVEKIVNNYIDRPVAIPIKIPVALHIPSPYGHSSYGATSPHFPLTHGGADKNTPFAHGGEGGTYARIPTKVLQSYYTKMLKKLVPQMQKAYKNSPLAAKPKTVPKVTPKPYNKLNHKISDILFDLKPPPNRPQASNWDSGARYQYDYNTLPLDMSASSSIDVGQQADRPGNGYKTNFDEFQRWRNGHNLKRSPDFGRNLHMEYGFKPPLVPSLEIDEKGMPLKSLVDLAESKDA